MPLGVTCKKYSNDSGSANTEPHFFKYVSRYSSLFL